jgi:hypothetical protein
MQNKSDAVLYLFFFFISYHVLGMKQLTVHNESIQYDMVIRKISIPSCQYFIIELFMYFNSLNPFLKCIKNA